MSPEVTAAIIAGFISLVGLGASCYVTYRGQQTERELRQDEIKSLENRMREDLEERRSQWQADLSVREEQWQESFRAELRRDLVRESSLEAIRERRKLYGDVWKALRITAGHEWSNLHRDARHEAVQEMADTLTDYAYSEVGMLMSDRSRRLLLHLRSGCGEFLQQRLSDGELKRRAHLLKHSLRSDLGIDTELYENELKKKAEDLGRPDDWTEKD